MEALWPSCVSPGGYSLDHLLYKGPETAHTAPALPHFRGGGGAQAQWRHSAVWVAVVYQVALCPGRRSQGAEGPGSILLPTTSIGREKFVSWAPKFGGTRACGVE